MALIGRERELAFLESQYRMDHPLTLITGRRRIGKSSLVLEFLKGKNSLYFEAGKETGTMILRSFSKAVSETVGHTTDCFESWEDAIRAYLESAPAGRKVLVIDDVHNIIAADDSFSGKIQGIWDRLLSREDVMVVLCSPSTSTMEKIALEYRAPLYGRFTGNLAIMPLPFHDTIGDRDYRRAVEEYAVTGGVPHYMMLMDPDVAVLENIEKIAMDIRGPLLYEPELLLTEEFRDLSGYNTYLKAIASGNRRSSGLMSAVQSPSNIVLPYLRRLINVGMIERRVPITEGENSRKGMYVISDHFIALWFRFVYPYLNSIQRMDSDAARSDLRAHFIESHVSFVFEDICRAELRDHLRSKGVMASYGSYWEGNVELDVVAEDAANRTLYVGECKYRSTPIDADVLRTLRAKCLSVRPFKDYRIVHCLFSVSGYTDRAVADAETDGTLLFDCGKVL